MFLDFAASMMPADVHQDDRRGELRHHAQLGRGRSERRVIWRQGSTYGSNDNGQITSGRIACLTMSGALGILPDIQRHL